MAKLLNIFLLILFLIFFLTTYKYYSSNKNIKNIGFNRGNIDQIISEKISNLPVLNNNTNNIIEFNDGFTNQIKDNKPRSFWNLLK